MFGARWNPIGVRVVYTSTSLALAAVEAFVNSDPHDFPDDLIVAEAILPASFTVETLEVESVATRATVADLSATRRMGENWIRSHRSAALKVPSFAVEGDWNVLLNPEHPGFGLIERLPLRPWHFDARMFRRPRPER